MSFAARFLGLASGTSASNSGTLTADFVAGGSGYDFYTGYDSAYSGGAYGSTSTNTFADGKIFVAAYDYSLPYSGYLAASVTVGGFASNPGIGGYMTSFTVNGVTKVAASATTYLYDSPTGRATWLWGGFSPQSWGMTYGSTYAWSKA
jgi:hypothetical protein